MATTADDLEDILNCTICLEIFKEPYIFQCLHTVCKSCLNKLKAEKIEDTVKCPECRTVTKEDDIKKDFNKQTLLDIYHKSKVCETAGHSNQGRSYAQKVSKKELVRLKENEEEQDDEEVEIGDGDDDEESDDDEAVGHYYETLAAFDGEMNEDLSFEAGEILYVIKRRPDGWCTAENAKGKRGIVPITFLRICNKPVKNKGEDPNQKASISNPDDSLYKNLKPWKDGQGEDSSKPRKQLSLDRKGSEQDGILQHKKEEYSVDSYGVKKSKDIKRKAKTLACVIL